MATTIKNKDEEIKIDPTANTDKVATGYKHDEWNGGTGVAGQTEQLAQNVINMNYDDFTKGNDYQSLVKRYSQTGRRAMDDTMGMAAARTGGLASSYAVAAGNQAYNDHMSKLEDAARALYDSQRAEAKDNYNIAQGMYDRQYGEWQDGRDFGYGMYRDTVEDAQWKDEQTLEADKYDYTVNQDTQSTAQNEIMAAIEAGKSITNIDPDLITASGYSAEYWDNYATIYNETQLKENSQTKDKELSSIFTSDGFLWGDWDGDGFVEGENEGTSFDEKFGGSSYGEAYWKTVYDNAARDRSEKNQSDNSADIEARIYNGESLDDIETFYGIDGTNKTWESETGKSKAEWQSIYNGNQIKGYTYANTAEGSENIVSSLVRSASMTLNDKDAGNFDYIFGDGAYDAVQRFIKKMSPNDDPNKDTGFTVSQDMNPGLFNDYYNGLVDSLVAAVPGLSYDQILDIVKKANPNAYKAATDDTWLKYSSYEEWKNTPAG